MPGNPVNDQQVSLYMHDRQTHSQRTAAARAGFSERGASTPIRVCHRPGRVVGQDRARPPIAERLGADPLTEVWEQDLLPILEREPAVQAVTLLRHLQQLHAERFVDDSVRRTLERRVRDWRALHGAAKDVIFRQSPPIMRFGPGRMALSDFTDASRLGVTIAGEVCQATPGIDPLAKRRPLGQAVTVSVGCGAEAVAVAAGGEDVAVVEQTVEDGGGDDGVAEAVPHSLMVRLEVIGMAPFS